MVFFPTQAHGSPVIRLVVAIPERKFGAGRERSAPWRCGVGFVRSTPRPEHLLSLVSQGPRSLPLGSDQIIMHRRANSHPFIGGGWKR